MGLSSSLITGTIFSQGSAAAPNCAVDAALAKLCNQKSSGQHVEKQYYVVKK